MSQDKLNNLLLLISLLSQVDVDVVVTVRTGIQQNLSGGWSNIITVVCTSPITTTNVPISDIFQSFMILVRTQYGTIFSRYDDFNVSRILPLSLSSQLTWPGLWSHSWGSGWFPVGAPGPNTNIPIELAPAPAYQKTDRKYETRRKTPWLTGRERGEASIRIISG